MKKFYLAVLAASYMLYSHPGKASIEGGELSSASSSISSAPQAILIQYKDFTFNPDALKFEDKHNFSGFWFRAGEIAGELGAFYTGKHQKTSQQLDEEQKVLEGLIAEKKKGIRLQESVIQNLSQKQVKNDNFKSVFSSLSTHLNHAFYLLTLNPDLVVIQEFSFYDRSTGTSKTIKYCNLAYQVDKEIEAIQAQIDPRINLGTLKNELNHIFNFLKDYAARLQKKEKDFAAFGKAYLKIQSFANDSLMLGIFESLNIQPEKFRGATQKILSEKIDEFDDEMIQEVAPLGEFHNLLIQTIESFQKELKDLAHSQPS